MAAKTYTKYTTAESRVNLPEKLKKYLDEKLPIVEEKPAKAKKAKAE